MEVDVNGEEVFVVDARIISSYSGRIKKLFSKSKGVSCCKKLIFHDFPGGAACFELIIRFCYDEGNITVTPFNFPYLACACSYMEMNKRFTGTENLYEQIETTMEDIKYWTWSELLVALKQCQELLTSGSSLSILAKCVDCLVSRIVSSCEASPCPSTSSPDSSGFRFSCDTRSTDGVKSSFFRESWWFEDLVSFDTCLVEILIKSMIKKNFDNGIVGRFLFYYQKSTFASASTNEKAKIIATVVEILDNLETRYLSYKGLFGILRVSANMNLNRTCRSKLEKMIGSRLDEATLDNLLFPSPNRKMSLYDVNLVLKLLKFFFGNGVCAALSRQKKVARLLDSYLAEVSPDPYLKPAKFLALIKAVPDSARESCDEVYYAVNLYLEVHSALPEEQKIEVCGGVDYSRLSSDAMSHLFQNPEFPPRSAVQALVSQQISIKGLLQDTTQDASLSQLDSRLSSLETSHKEREDECCQKIVLYAKKLDFSDENEKMKSHLQGMQWRVMELEKDCRRMQDQMAKMVKSRLSNNNKAKAVPKLCP